MHSVWLYNFVGNWQLSNLICDREIIIKEYESIMVGLKINLGLISPNPLNSNHL